MRRELLRTLSFLGWLGALIVMVFCARPSYGQAYLGTINGTVTDQTGAAILDAQIQVIDENTHFVSPATTNNSGLYSVPYLSPGTYDVKVEANGFANAEQTGAVLIATGIKEVDFRLSPAAATTKVTVTANQQLLDTESATVETVLTSNILHNSPDIDANPIMMSTRVAGVYSNFTQNTQTTQWDPQGGGISGSEIGAGVAGDTLFTINGIDELASRGTPGQYTGYVPSSLALQELNVQTAPYDASVGHTLVGVQNVVLKTGTERLHGEAEFQYGDRIFNSNFYNRTALGQPRPSDTWSMPGFVVTGPVIIPKLLHGANHKTFFMASWEHFQYNIATYIGVSDSVPTVKERAGDFSELSTAGAASGNPLEGVIYDPTTTVPVGAPSNYAPWCAGLSGGCTAGMRESFTQEYNEGSSNTSVCNGDTNCIPTNRFNPVGVALLQYYPLPTSINSTSPANGNYSPSTISAPDIEWVGAFEVSQEFNENNKLTATFLPYVATDLGKGYNFPIINGYSGGGYDLQYQKEWGGLLDYTRIITPTTVVDARVGGTYSPFTQVHASANMPLSVLGITGESASFPYPNFPAVSATGPFVSYTSLDSGASNFWYGSLIDGHAELTKTFQRHSIKTGAEYLLARDDYQDPESAFANSSFPLNFTTIFTSSNPTNTSLTSTSASGGEPAKYGGDGIASLLLGYPGSGDAASSGAAVIQPAPNIQYDYWAGFVQDDWRLTHKLTLNVGMRYEYYSPYTERHNGLEAGFNFSSPQPFNLPNATGTGIASSIAPPASAAVPQGYTGGLYFVDTAAYPSRQYTKRDLEDGFDPRIGASYILTPNTVLRGGFAVFLAPFYPGVQTNGFSSTTQLNATTNNWFTPATCSSSQGADAYGFCNLTNPYPNGYVQPTGNLLGLSTGLGSSLAFAGPVNLPDKDRVWTVGIERQLPLNMMVDVEYHGNEVNGLGISKNWNALPDCYYYGGGCPNAGNATALGASVTNPMAGYLPSSSTLNAAKLPQSDLYLPYPEFTTVTQGNVSTIPGTHQRLGWQLDNALYLTVVKRTSYGLEFHAAFSYEKVEDKESLLNAGDPVTAAYKDEDGQPDRYLNGDLVYNTPKLNVNRALGYVVNNWQWTHSLNWQAGVSIGVPGSAFASSGPDITHHQTLAHWFNTCYIPVVANGNVGQTLNGVVNTSPVYGTPTNCQNGDQPAWIQQPTQTLNQITGNMRDVQLNEIPYYDMALAKIIPVHEGYTLMFRAEAHNVFNNALIGQTGPTTTLTSGTFGQFPLAGTVNGNSVYAQANDPRIVRFEARFSF
jgi:Carboxypeptidase regulatory-like domain